MLMFTQVSALALNKEQVVPSLQKTVEEYLKSKSYKYKYFDDDYYFSLEFTHNNALEGSILRISLYDDMVSASVFTRDDVPEKNRDKMAKLITLINDVSDYCQFRMDFDDGQLACRSYILVESVLPGVAEIGTLVSEPLAMTEKYGDAIHSVMTKGADPVKAFQKAYNSK